MSIKVNVKNEYGKLKRVLMASIETFKLHSPINKTQELFYKSNPPVMDIMIEQQRQFVKLLEENGVGVVWAPKRMDCTNQINTRDVGFAIGNSFVISPMKKKERQNEHLALETVVNTFANTNIYRPNEGVIEGGDVILDNGKIFVGISERTNWAGYRWLVNTYGKDYQICPIELNSGYLHLDVVFNILSGGYALLHEDGIKAESLKEIGNQYDIIFVDASEQDNLATNVFSISPDTVICDCRNTKTNAKLLSIGKRIIEISFDEITKIGGSFRCSTCPLVRE